jgi:hypothetical protein
MVLKRKLRRRLGSPAGRRSALGELRFALEEGRNAMAEREAELRRRFQPPPKRPARHNGPQHHLKVVERQPAPLELE